MRRILIAVVAFIGLCHGSGCVVPQPRGEGQYMHVQEPASKAWYHLYLPVDYVRNNGRHPHPKMKKWPLVMTFHGMKPYDNALPQEREWEKQADIYGYIVCAPELTTSDSFMEYPLTREHEYVLQDRRNVIAIMDHVFHTTQADPNKVLSTSWSCGGYLAHYFPNRYPARFAAIATRLSNFSSRLMIEETVPDYREKVPVAVYIGDGDFPACKSESEEAVAWYQARGFRVVRGKMIDNMGHQRIPQTAAAFFAEQIGLEPLRPLEAAQTLALVQMTDYHPPQDLIARLSPPTGTLIAAAQRSPSRAAPANAGHAQPVTPPVVPPTARYTLPPPAPAQSTTARPTAFAAQTAGRRYPMNRPPSYDPTPEPIEPIGTSMSSETTKPLTALASADRPRNWLEPNRTPEKPATPPRTIETQSLAHAPSPTPQTESKQAPTNAKRPENRKPTPTAITTHPRHSEKAVNDVPRSGDRISPPQSAQVASANSQQPFHPQNVGRRDYERLMDTRPAGGTTARTPSQDARSAKGATRLTQLSAPPRSTAQHVNIRINGPAIGTAPYYLRFSVDLPREKLDSADVLWMDNGVWLSDKQGDNKILDTPGLHFITVLIVDKEGVEYRGQAKVQVLERTPTAGNFNDPQPGKSG